ncbi:hypothetical protein [Bacillus coreaensis]
MIGLPLTLVIALTLALVFYFQKKTFTFLHNSIQYMLLTIITTNVITLLSLNLSWIKPSDNPLVFPAILLYRDVNIPLLVLILINGFYSTKLLRIKASYLFISFLGLIAMDVLLTTCKILEYTKWNLFFAAVTNVGYLLIGLLIGKCCYTL